MNTYLVYVNGVAIEYVNASDFDCAITYAESKWQGYRVWVKRVDVIN